MGFKQFKPVKGTLMLDASGNPRDVSLEMPYHEADHLIHVTILPTEQYEALVGEWMTRAEFEAGADNSKRTPCWITSSTGREYMCIFHEGRYKGCCLASGQEINTEGAFVDEVQPIPAPSAPSGELK